MKSRRLSDGLSEEASTGSGSEGRLSSIIAEPRRFVQRENVKSRRDCRVKREERE
jgi:hypothetical protein